ncbi:Vps5 C terminal like-domain-containing protein [Auriculariales sp. MPI-PUGE-AT-0066]|nr:Vps5 C terminal like-domain-containing protein [Auriculariales sp. MPI-PUGE-AT-0066]
MFDPLSEADSPWGAAPAPIAPPPPMSNGFDSFDGGSRQVPNAISPGLANAHFNGGGGPASPNALSPGLYGREPQIYGAAEPGLVSPSVTTAANGARLDKPEPYLRVRITALDRNRRDILVRFDAQTNLPHWTGNAYRNVSRSYFEFQQFYEHIVQTNPQTIIPALPLAQTSAPTDEEDDRLVRVMLQRWLTRISEDPILLQDDELRAFVESDFGYQPTVRPRRKGSSGFSLFKTPVPDEDEHLMRARFELTRLETHFFEAAKSVDKLARSRKTLSTAHAEMGNKFVSVATTETHPPLATGMRKVGRAWHSLADLDQAQAISECVILGDSLGYQGLNARSARETLLQRAGVLEEHQAAVKNTISKRRQIERLKASSNIRPDRVDEALEDLEEASKYEAMMTHRVDGISQNLHRALQTHSRMAHDDITAALIEHARSSLVYERQLLRELESLRPDIRGAAGPAPEPSKLPPPPVRPLDEPPLVRAMPPSQIQTQQYDPALRAPSGSRIDGLPGAASQAHFGLPGAVSQAHYGPGPTGPAQFAPSPLRPQFQSGPMTPAQAAMAAAAAAGHVVKMSLPAEPFAARSPLDPLSPVSPGAGSSRMTPSPSPLGPGPAAGSGGPPLRVYPNTLPVSPATPGPPSSRPSSAAPMLPATNGHADPLGGGRIAQSSTIAGSAISAPVSPAPGAGPAGRFLDPLSQSAFVGHAPQQQQQQQQAYSPLTGPLGGTITTNTMARSMQLPPTRSRLDAREAAAKLANFL